MQINVEERYLATKEELKQLSDNVFGFVYATQTKYIPKIGHVNELSFLEVLKAKKFLNELNTNQFEVEMVQLGI